MAMSGKVGEARTRNDSTKLIPDHTERRKVFAQAFGPKEVEQLRPKLMKAVRRLLVQLLDEPENFREHIRL